MEVESLQKKRMKGLLLSAYDAGSHKYWRQGLVSGLNEIDWTVLTLPARYFSWRIRGNPISFIEQYSNELSQEYDFIIATSVVDLATLRGLIPSLAVIPALVYFHENQFEYPQSKLQKSNLEAQMVNLYSAMAADLIVFNSDYNRSSFLSGCEVLMKKLPDFTLKNISARLLQKSSIIPVPITDSLFKLAPQVPLTDSPIKILWNHRWEYDKGPDRLLLFLVALSARKVSFEINIVGEGFRTIPAEFEQIKQQFSQQVKAFGYIASVEDYFKLLSECDIVLSTAIHEFQGVAVMEALAVGCMPLVPDRLSYKEFIDGAFRYQSDINCPENEADYAVDTLLAIRAGKLPEPRLSESLKQYSWSELIVLYRKTIQHLVQV